MVLPTFDLDQRLGGVFRMPARMTVLPLAGGELALVSPIPFDDATAAAVDALGRVRYLIAPNLLHHLYLADAAKRFPEARVLAPPGLARKRPDLRIDGTLDAPPADLEDAVDVIPIEGAPFVDEAVLFHRASRTMVVTDLLFNVTAPKGLVAHVVLGLAGVHGKLGQGREWRWLVKDRARASASFARMLALPTASLVVAHGDNVDTDAMPMLAGALGHWTR